MARVFIGVGHGGSDPGAVANGMREKDINLVMGAMMKVELERHGLTVGISRNQCQQAKHPKNYNAGLRATLNRFECFRMRGKYLSGRIGMVCRAAS